MCCDGFFDADMHPGNLLSTTAGMLVVVDFGIVGRLGKKERRFSPRSCSA